MIWLQFMFAGSFRLNAAGLSLIWLKPSNYLGVKGEFIDIGDLDLRLGNRHYRRPITAEHAALGRLASTFAD